MEYGPIQVFPPGLLGFLQLKNQGKNPNILPDKLQPTMEMRDWMFVGQARDFGQSTAALANGATGFNNWATAITVPQDEIWWIANYHIEATLAAATDVVDFQGAFSTITVGTTQRYAPVGVRQTLLAGSAAGRRAVAYSEGFFVPPGSQIGLLVTANETVAASIGYQGYLRYVPMLV